jgi:hypothetical protein
MPPHYAITYAITYIYLLTPLIHYYIIAAITPRFNSLLRHHYAITLIHFTDIIIIDNIVLMPLLLLLLLRHLILFIFSLDIDYAFIAIINNIIITLDVRH